MCFRQNEFTDYSLNSDPIAQNTHRLVQRVEELEDLVVELKSKQSATEVVELKQLVSQLEMDNLQNSKIIGLLQQKRMSSKELFAQNEMHSSYLSIMKEREKIIEQMHGQIKKLGDKIVMNVSKADTYQSFGQLNNFMKQQQSNANTSPLATYSASERNVVKQDNFEEEKIKDAVNFKNLMQTVHHSNGFANLHQAQNVQHTDSQQEKPGPNVSTVDPNNFNSLIQPTSDQ